MVITECKLPPKYGFVEEELPDGTRIYAPLNDYKTFTESISSIVSSEIDQI